MMKNLIESELVSKYRYAIVADARGTIFCKQDCIPVTGPIKENFCPYYDAPHDYMEDFSFRFENDNVELYIGDMNILTLKSEELEIILTHIHQLKEYSDEESN